MAFQRLWLMQKERFITWTLIDVAFAHVIGQNLAEVGQKMLDEMD